MEKKVMSNKLYIDRWIYSEPKLVPDSEGNIKVIYVKWKESERIINAEKVINYNL